MALRCFKHRVQLPHPVLFVRQLLSLPGLRSLLIRLKKNINASMAAGLNPGPDSDSQDPYSLLGISPDAGFEEVQGARDRVVAACGDDAIAKARVEAAYDAVLMARLRDRQSGRVSSEGRHSVTNRTPTRIDGIAPTSSSQLRVAATPQFLFANAFPEWFRCDA